MQLSILSVIYIFELHFQNNLKFSLLKNTESWLKSRLSIDTSKLSNRRDVYELLK